VKLTGRTAFGVRKKVNGWCVYDDMCQSLENGSTQRLRRQEMDNVEYKCILHEVPYPFLYLDVNSHSIDIDDNQLYA
jgi:hypothetical protein